MKEKKPRRRYTYEDIVDRYIAMGFHPLSAKAQADEWKKVRDWKDKREKREKDQR